MAFNIYHGMSQADLEEALAQAQTAALSGGALISGTSGDVSIARQPDVKTDTRIKQILKALSRLDPEKYPPDECSPITQTRTVFRQRYGF